MYLDPPWQYRDKALAGNRGAECKYPVLTIQQLKELPVPDIADTNCLLFMWITMPKLNKVFSLIESWEFAYKTAAFTWVKQNKKSDGWFWGMGRWTRANAELCLLATKGKPQRVNAGVSSLIVSHLREHSQKPDEARDRIVQLVGDIPRIELFARRRFPGWYAWGNELEPSNKVEEEVYRILGGNN